MSIKLKKLAAGSAILAVAVAGLVSTDASALPAGSPADGTNTLSPLSFANTATFSLTPPAGAACQGDSASGGYRWQTFMVPSSVDAGTLTYNASGPIAPAGVTFTQPLFSAGSPVIQRTTAVTSGVLTPIPTYTFPAGLTVPAGSYDVGYACTLAGATTRYWETPVTVSSTGATTFNVAFGAAPAPANITSASGGDTTLNGSFTLAAATPALTTLTATATPQGGGAATTITLATSATSFAFTGLVNGTTYDVVVTATNSVGSSTSNTVSALVAPGAFPAVTNLAAQGQPEAIKVDWTAPIDSQPRTGYRLEIATDAAFASPIVGSPFTVGAAAVTYTQSGLTAGTVYYARITALYAAPYVGTLSNVVTATALSNAVIEQQITVVRPAGALVLTQRCGVYGALDAEAAVAGAFPVALPAETAVGGTGTAPIVINAGSPANGLADPLFNDYPYPQPANYATRCGVDMGTGRLVTSGPLAGNYYTAQGRLNQITIVNTSDLDNGWTLNGTMSDFTVAGGGASFSGNFLGWTPKVTSVSSGVTGSTTYNMVVNPGAGVDPNAPGLGTSKVLASAPAGSGLGITTLDARLKLLIPSSVRAGTYTGILTFSAV
ncbi:MAG: hypothetical protein RL238_160 [Actinomycetota bacterium]|jgi:hypothetical protein